jgi:hypothetical protein
MIQCHLRQLRVVAPDGLSVMGPSRNISIGSELLQVLQKLQAWCYRGCGIARPVVRDFVREDGRSGFCASLGIKVPRSVKGKSARRMDTGEDLRTGGEECTRPGSPPRQHQTRLEEQESRHVQVQGYTGRQPLQENTDHCPHLEGSRYYGKLGFLVPRPPSLLRMRLALFRYQAGSAPLAGLASPQGHGRVVLGLWAVLHCDRDKTGCPVDAKSGIAREKAQRRERGGWEAEAF